MKFEVLSIKELIITIESGKIFLPPIQRSFVWDYNRIIKLFDSLYRNYPIGNCIFWKIKPDTAKNYTLYKFISEYFENKKKNIRNEAASRNQLEDVFAVIDGQQRINSLYIGLRGIYRYKKRGKGLQNIDSNFVPSRLYVNLFHPDYDSENENFFFDFLGEEELILNEKNLWFEVGKILTWKNSNYAVDFATKNLQKAVIESESKPLKGFEKKKDKIIEMLKSMYDMLHEKRIYYFDIDNQNLDEVVELFTRVNSGGLTLKKSELLFSNLVAQWNEGRDEIKDLLDYMKENEVAISQDFIMRACLVLSDLPIKYKLVSFTRKNIDVIRKNWNDIKNSLIKLCEVLPEIGYTDLPNLSEFALIPIAYYIKNGGDCKSPKARKNLRLYYVVSQINEIFSSQTEQVLEKIRNEIKKQLSNDNILNYQGFCDINLPGNRSFKLSKIDLEERINNTSYGSPHAYFILSLTYPILDFKIRRYHIDHIHPRSKFNVANLNNNGIKDSNKIDNWIDEKRDLLPNLQLLASKDNLSKKAKTIIQYIKEIKSTDRGLFLRENLIPKDPKILELKNFDEFYEKRKKLLLKKLVGQLGI